MSRYPEPSWFTIAVGIGAVVTLIAIAIMCPWEYSGNHTTHHNIHHHR